MAESGGRMRLGEVLIKALGGATRTDLHMAEKRAYEAGVTFGGNDEPPMTAQGRSWAHGYRRFSMTNQQLADAEQDVAYLEALQRSEAMWRRHPFAKRLIEARLSQTFGNEVKVIAEDNPEALSPDEQGLGMPHRMTVQDVIDRFWNDRLNDMTEFSYINEKQLSIRGTCVYPVFVNRANGTVRIGMIPSRSVQDIISDPNDVRQPVMVIVQTPNGQRKYRVVHPAMDLKTFDPGEMSKDLSSDLIEDGRWIGLVRQAMDGSGEDEFGFKFDGACLLFRKNRLMDYKWGWPDLLHLLDWLEQVDEFFFDVAERVYWLTAFVWDVMLEGKDESQIRDWIKTQSAPKRGSIRAHNEKIKWEAVSPKLGAGEVKELSHVIVSFVGTVGFGLPPHVLGWPEGSNKATSVQQDAFMYADMQVEQHQMARRVESIIHFVIDQAIISGVLPHPDSNEGKNINWKFAVNMPQLSDKNTALLSQTLLTVANAIIGLEQTTLPIDDATWMNVIRSVLAEMNVKMVQKSPEQAKSDLMGSMLGAINGTSPIPDGKNTANVGAYGGPVTPGDVGMNGQTGAAQSAKVMQGGSPAQQLYMNLRAQVKRSLMKARETFEAMRAVGRSLPAKDGAFIDEDITQALKEAEDMWSQDRELIDQ